MSRFEWDNVSSIIAGDMDITLAATNRRMRHYGKLGHENKRQEVYVGQRSLFH